MLNSRKSLNYYCNAFGIDRKNYKRGNLKCNYILISWGKYNDGRFKRFPLFDIIIILAPPIFKE